VCVLLSGLLLQPLALALSMLRGKRFGSTSKTTQRLTSSCNVDETGSRLAETEFEHLDDHLKVATSCRLESWETMLLSPVADAVVEAIPLQLEAEVAQPSSDQLLLGFHRRVWVRVYPPFAQFPLPRHLLIGP